MVTLVHVRRFARRTRFLFALRNSTCRESDRPDSRCQAWRWRRTTMAPHRPLPRLRGMGREGAHNRIELLPPPPPPTLPRKRGREQTELAARADFIQTRQY